MPPPGKQTLVDQLTGQICRDLFAGDLSPGERIPSIRALSKAHGVTIPTTQRALERLSELGVVEVVHGSGAYLRDPRTEWSLLGLPYWMAAVLDDADTASEILADFLQLRRVLASAVLVHLYPALAAGAGGQVHAAIDALERAAAGAAPGREAFAEADVAVVRAMLAVRPQVAFAAIFNAFARLLEAVPGLPAAMYAQPEAHVAGYRAMVAAAEAGAPASELAATTESLLAQMDEACVARFVRQITDEEG